MTADLVDVWQTLSPSMSDNDTHESMRASHKWSLPKKLDVQRDCIQAYSNKVEWKKEVHK